jgi:uncharacterized delta-60 repeat protein
MKKYLVYFILSYSLFGYSQAGSFDTTFDADGKNTNCISQHFYATTSNFQSNGKIVSAGGNQTSCNVSIGRFNVDGSIDTSFGTNGFVFNSICSVFSAGNSYYSLDMVIQPDDKIVIMGLIQNNSGNAYWVARLLPDGALDPSFSADGYRDLSFGTIQDRGQCINLQADGKILLGGTSGNTGEFFTVARLLPNGDLDPSFGSNGVVQTAFSTSQSFANCIAVQQDGKIILGGYTINAPFARDFAMIRYLADGTIDSSFGVNGKVVTTVNTSFSDYIDKIVFDAQGRILVSGCASFEVNYKLAMARYTSNGVLDTSFGNNGIVVSNYPSRYSDVALQVDGKIILVGGYDADVFTVLRYLSNGTLDSSFGNNGFVDSNFNQPTYAYASSVLIQSDNKIIVTGSVASPDNTLGCSAIIRLNPGTLSNEEFSNTAVSLYPNPTNGLVFFDNSETRFANVRVYNYLGQEVMPSLSITSDNNSSIDVSGLSIGVYFLKFEGEQQLGWARVVKE